jgi:PhzF family phenazine biosynthesis protein
VLRQFRQVDVFSPEPYRGNPVAVVLDSDGLSTAQMQRFACWMNLSETTFVLPAAAPGADYQVRIFTPGAELPFAGHPTLGTCHAWLEAGGTPRRDGIVTQQCTAGLIRIARTAAGLGFAAPPLVRSGPVASDIIDQLAAFLRIDRSAIVAAQWADNGPGWVAVLLESAAAVLRLRPGVTGLDVGVCGLYPPGSEVSCEVRAFFPKDGGMAEDPVTGSLNASLAQWLIGTGRVTAPYVASQGTALGRRGLVHVSRDDNGTIWVAGATVTRVTGQVDL